MTQADPGIPRAEHGTLLSIQTGRVRPLMVSGRKLASAIGKTPVTDQVEVGVLGLLGDEQADPTVHGGLSKAVYALPSEHLPWWRAQRQRVQVWVPAQAAAGAAALPR